MDNELEGWVHDILSDPVKKEPVDLSHYKTIDEIIDARVFLPNTQGYSDWLKGQDEYEKWERDGKGYADDLKAYQDEIARDRPIYQHILMSGRILDVGGGAGIVREHLSDEIEFIAIDPFSDCLRSIPSAKQEAYSCLSNPLNFIAACAEFLPFRSSSFDWVHMRSMIDHLQVPDLALIEAHRVLKDGGKLVIGLSVVGGKNGRPTPVELAKGLVKDVCGMIGLNSLADHHMFHPTLANLKKLINDNGFDITDTYWQPFWNGRVVYLTAQKIVP